jgi:GNAT superfamily N-acetyltransferase
VSAAPGRAPVANAGQVERGLASLVEAYRRVARGAERGAIEERDHVTSVATGMPVAAFNPTFVVEAPRDPTLALDRGRDFYARSGVAGEVNAWGDTVHTIADAARDAGFVAGHGIPCLLLAPLVEPPAPVAGLQVRKVHDATALLRFNDVCAEVFGLGRQVLTVLDDPRLLELRGFAFHLGLVDDAPVATAMSCCIDGVALVFNIATLTSHRRRGIGEAMTWRTVRDGLEEGCDIVFLQSSTAGRSLYERMGFRHTIDVQTWTLP